MALAAFGWHVIALRILDRVGKGIRTSPRDALLSESTDSDVRGLSFSFHRLMDHSGAVCGPLIAAIFLYCTLGHNFMWHQGGGIASAEEMRAMRWLFAIALIPGIAAMAVLWLQVRESPLKATHDTHEDQRKSPASKLPSRFFIFLGAVILFTLGNSSDLFLIFYAQTRFGFGLGWVLALWVILHLSKIIFSLPGGKFSDRVGRRPAIITGWLIYVVVYLAMPFASEFWMTLSLLLVYGAYYGMTEGAERALVADIVPSPQRGKAYGLYHGAVGLAALPASLVFGVLWAKIGPQAAFIIGASLAASALLLLLCCYSGKKNNPIKN